MNKGFQWITEHKGLSAAIAAVIFVGVYLISKASGGGSSSATSSTGLTPADASFLQSQAGLQAAAASTNANVTIAQIQAGTDRQAIAANEDITNNQTAAQLQATQAGYQAAEDINSTNVAGQENLAAQQYAATTTTTLAAIQANQNAEESQQNLAASELSDVTKIGGSQNRLALLQSILGATGNTGETTAAGATEASEAQIQSQPNWFAQSVGAISGAVTSVARGFFGNPIRPTVGIQL